MRHGRSVNLDLRLDDLFHVLVEPRLAIAAERAAKRRDGGCDECVFLGFQACVGRLHLRGWKRIGIFLACWIAFRWAQKGASRAERAALSASERPIGAIRTFW